MAKSLNKASLIGNVGGEPDVRVTPSGTRVASLSLATNERFTDRSGQRQERTQWHRLKIFGTLVEVVEQWVKKGDRLYVEGRIEYSQSQDQQGGTRYWTDIVVRDLIMLGSRGGVPGAPPDGGHGGGSRAPAPAPALSEPDDDLPF